MDFNKPILGASEEVIRRLGEGYLATIKDIIRLNYIHLVCLTLIEKEPGKSYQYYVRTAIERLTIDMGFKHYDPYELWIDAGYFNPKLEETNDVDITNLFG